MSQQTMQIILDQRLQFTNAKAMWHEQLIAGINSSCASVADVPGDDGLLSQMTQANVAINSALEKLATTKGVPDFIGNICSAISRLMKHTNQESILNNNTGALNETSNICALNETLMLTDWFLAASPPYVWEQHLKAASLLIEATLKYATRSMIHNSHDSEFESVTRLAQQAQKVLDCLETGNQK
jgi:hypothetical protein